jgi:hypothetical protein
MGVRLGSNLPGQNDLIAPVCSPRWVAEVQERNIRFPPLITRAQVKKDYSAGRHNRGLVPFWKEWP